MFFFKASLRENWEGAEKKIKERELKIEKNLNYTNEWINIYWAPVGAKNIKSLSNLDPVDLGVTVQQLQALGRH